MEQKWRSKELQELIQEATIKLAKTNKINSLGTLESKKKKNLQQLGKFYLFV